MSISPDELPPVWSHKDETDNCYNQCVKMLLSAVREDVSSGEGDSASNNIATGTNHAKLNKLWSSWLKGLAFTGPPATHTKLPSIGVLFGTHNWESARLVLAELVNNGLAEALPEEPRQEDGEVAIKVKPEAVERVAIAQLFGTYATLISSFLLTIFWTGMSDDLTQYLVNRTKAPTPFVIK